MGRKNRAAKRRPQVRKLKAGEPRTKPRRVPPPVPLEKMVLPVGRCGRKVRFATEQQAAAALKQAQQNRAHKGQSRAEKRFYFHQTCQGYHLTATAYYKNEVQQP